MAQTYFDVLNRLGADYQCDRRIDNIPLTTAPSNIVRRAKNCLYFVVAAAAAAASSGESSTNDEPAPSNWTLYRGSLATCVLQMYQSPGPAPLDRPVSDLKTVNLIESFLRRTWTQTRSRGRIEVVAVRRIENPLLYQTYVARRNEIALSVKESKRPIVEVGARYSERGLITNVLGKLYS